MLKAILLALGAVAVAAHKVRTPGHQYPHKAHHNNPLPDHLSRRSRRSSSKRSRLVLPALEALQLAHCPNRLARGVGRDGAAQAFADVLRLQLLPPPDYCRPQRSLSYFSQYLSTQRCTGAEVP